MKKKELIAILIALALMLSMAACGAKSTDFSDLDQEPWCSEYVQALAQNGIVTGFDDGTYQPRKYITAGEFVKMLALADGAEVKKLEARHWAFPYWEYLDKFDVFNGTHVTGLRTCLDNAITRSEASVIIYNMMVNVRGEDMEAINNPAANIPGYISLDKPYLLPVAELYAKGILTGFENLSFDGDHYLTRGAAAAMISRLYNDFARTVAEPMKATGTYTSLGAFSESTLFVGDSLTYEFIENYLIPYGMIGDASYMAVPCTTVKYFLARYWVMTPSEDNRYGVACNEEFEGLPFAEALAKNADRYSTVFFLLGSNASTTVTKTQYTSAIKLILQHNPAATIYMQTVPDCDTGTVDSQRVNDMIKQTVTDFDDDSVQLLDTNNIWNKKDIADDGVHLTVDGLDTWYKFICDNVKM